MAEFDSTLKGVSKDLQKVIDQLTKWSKLNDQLATSTAKIRKGVQGDGKLGAGSQKMLDGALASFSGMDRGTYRDTRNFLENGMGRFSMGSGVARMATAAIGNLGQIAGGVSSMMPDLGATFARASTYYGGVVASGGAMSRGALETRTQQLIGKGNQTGLGSDAAAAAYLSGRGMAPTSAAFGQTLKTVGGMSQLFNMSNVSAATAVEGLSSGAGSSSLLRNFGIYTSNPVTGQTVSPQQIISQIKGRLTAGRGKFTTEDVQESFRKGALGVSLQSLSPDQQSMVMTSLMGDASDSKTGPVDLNSQESMMAASKAMGGNPNAPAMKVFGAKNKAMQNAEGSYMAGADVAAGALSALNDAAGALASTFLGMAHSAGGTFMGDPVGQGFGAIAGGVGNIAGTMVAGKMLGLGGGAQLGGALGAKAGGMLSGAAKFATGPGGKLLGGLGVTAAGAGLMFQNGTDAYNTAAAAGAEGVDPGTAAMNVLGGAASGALSGAGIGFMFGGAVGAGIGAGIGAVVGGANSLFQMNQGATTTGAGGDDAAKAPGAVSGAGGKDQRQVGNNGRPSLIHPTSGPLGDKFGDFQEYRSQPHRGQDYKVNTGTLVWAAADGEVIAITGNQGQLGLQVKISHGGGYVTSYCHLSNNNFVSVGTKVKAKDKIGLSGNTGTATTGQHLHFAIEKGGQAMDPLSFMGGPGAGASASNTQDSSGGGAASSEPGGGSMGDSTPVASAGSNAVSAGRGGISGAGAGAAALLGSAGSSSTTSGHVDTTGSGGEGVNGTSLVPTSGAANAIKGNSKGNGNGSGSSHNVTINVNLKNATDSEARKFAKRVKEYLEDEKLMSNMGAF